MAEVIPYWPDSRQPRPARFQYPWEQWMALDENDRGDIWLAEMGVDFPADSSVWTFRSTLYDRAKKLTAQRRRDAPLVLMRVKGTDQVRRVPRYTRLRVKVRIVSLTQVAFQFYEGEQAPPMPPRKSETPIAVPTRTNRARTTAPVGQRPISARRTLVEAKGTRPMYDA